jgi:hypothetical protein
LQPIIVALQRGQTATPTSTYPSAAIHYPCDPLKFAKVGFLLFATLHEVHPVFKAGVMQVVHE